MPKQFDSVLFSEVFGSHELQFELALETLLVLCSDYDQSNIPDEVYLEYNGQRLRWINGDESTLPVLITPVTGGGLHELSRLFINRLIFENNNVTIREREWIIVNKSITPSLIPNRILALHQHPYEFLMRDTTKWSDEKELALSLYREGRNSDSPFYRFLNYYKVCQIPFIDPDNPRNVNQRAMEGWIDSENVDVSGLVDYKSPLSTYLGGVRHAVAHVEELRATGSPSVDPSNVLDYIKVVPALDVVEVLARRAVVKCP